MRICLRGLGGGLDPEVYRHGVSTSVEVESLTLNRFGEREAKAASPERESAGRKSNPQLALASNEPSAGHGVYHTFSEKVVW